MMNSEKYRAPVICKNCEFKNYSNFPKGTPISESPCPKCGCKALRQPGTFELDQINRLPENRGKYENSGVLYDFGDLGDLRDIFNNIFKEFPPKK